jgi:pimeloyl-ACP methyl ester carboxylesterase
LRCTVEEQVFATVHFCAQEAAANLHHIQCPCVFATGALTPEAAANQDVSGDSDQEMWYTTFGRAAHSHAQRCIDAAYMMFPGADHFMPFTQPDRLAAGIMRAFGAEQLAQHVRWLALELDQEQDLSLIRWRDDGAHSKL